MKQMLVCRWEKGVFFEGTTRRDLSLYVTKTVNNKHTLLKPFDLLNFVWIRQLKIGLRNGSRAFLCAVGIYECLLKLFQPATPSADSFFRYQCRSGERYQRRRRGRRWWTALVVGILVPRVQAFLKGRGPIIREQFQETNTRRGTPTVDLKYKW